MVVFSFIVSLYVSDLLNVTTRQGKVKAAVKVQVCIMSLAVTFRRSTPRYGTYRTVLLQLPAAHPRPACSSLPVRYVYEYSYDNCGLYDSHDS